MKFRGCDPEPGEPDEEARISNILYENIYMDQPSQFAIWIGPAQQYIINSRCSILWPQLQDIDGVDCVGARNSLYENITLRNITISDPLFRYNTSHLQRDPGGLAQGFVDLDLGSSPGWWPLL